jgi:hypothetical protein
MATDSNFSEGNRMRRFSFLGIGLAALAPLTWAAGLSRSGIQGEYVEARTADVYTGSCFANGEAQQVGNLAIFGWKVESGSWDGVKLDGLSVVGVVRASNTLGAGLGTFPVDAVLIVDERAGAMERLALGSFARHAAQDLLGNVVRVDYRPITLTLKDNNLHTAAATLDAGLARIETRALEEGDQICHNEETFYPPLAQLDHAMPAYTLDSRFEGQGLGTTWSSPGKRSAFVGSFHYQN